MIEFEDILLASRGHCREPSSRKGTRSAMGRNRLTDRIGRDKGKPAAGCGDDDCDQRHWRRPGPATAALVGTARGGGDGTGRFEG